MHPVITWSVALACLSCSLVACATTGSYGSDQAEPEPPKLARLADVDAPQSAVWDMWTSTDGVRTFLSPEANVSKDVGGPYELLFVPEAPEGLKGTEGCTVLVAVPERKLSFEVIPPPSLGLSDTRTTVTVRMTPLSEESTRVQIVHEGLVEGAEWDATQGYFSGVWTDALTRLRARFAEGPLDWSQRGDDFEWR